MKLKPEETPECDVLIIGGGGAGLRSAIAARLNNANVLMASKSRIGHSTNTYISKAVIAASGWGDPGDNENVHTTDTIRGGRFLNDQAMVARIAERVSSEIDFLKECGVNWGMEEGRPRVLKLPGHKHPRHVHGENWTGSDLILPLRRRAKEIGVHFREHVFITRLLASEGRITGAAGITPDGSFLAIKAKIVILATGGYAQIFLNTNNAAGITGDGHALCYDLGISLKDMEFVQFYPTAMGRRGSRLLLYEKMLAQKGVVLKNGAGEDIIRKNGFADSTSMTRDQLAQLIIKEIRNDSAGKQSVIMDIGSLSEEKAGQLKQLLPPAWWKGQKAYEVAPTAHFCMGGVVTDQWGETSLGGLFAVGEVTGGAHGANRLGGNALAEVFAMGSLVGTKAGELAAKIGTTPLVQEEADSEKLRLEEAFSDQGPSPKELIRELKTLMWNKVGIIREKNEVEEALGVIRGNWDRASAATPADLIRLSEFRNMRLVAEMVCKAALKRTESRGSHFRTDYPGEDNDLWLKNIVFRKGDAGMEAEAEPVHHDLVEPS
ncbi:FAD-binding protein [Desulfococcaceae bacterium HSG8]|nr:FAD-binding protein [Desulfococcaceae bacterium HSG8]